MSKRKISNPESTGYTDLLPPGTYLGTWWASQVTIPLEYGGVIIDTSSRGTDRRINVQVVVNPDQTCKVIAI